MTRLDEITQALKELKSEYSIIRKEILGIGLSESTSCQGMGLLEDKTLREIVEETQFEVKQIKSKMLDCEFQQDITKKTNLNRGVKLNESEDHQSLEEFPVVEIQRKTIAEQRNWMKKKFNHTKKTMARIVDGESFGGTTVEEISSSSPLSAQVNVSCTIKLSNYLDSALTDPQYFFLRDYIYSNNGLSEVAGRHQEFISFLGEWNCSFLCSFAISRILRLTVRCYSNFDGAILFGIGFTPADIPIDQALFDRLLAMPAVPDVWMIKGRNNIPLELFVSHRNLLVRGHMTPGPRSIVHVEILETSPEIVSTHSRNEIKNCIVAGKSIKLYSNLQNLWTIPKLTGDCERFSYSIQIVNCLSVTLRNRGKLYCKCENNGVIPFEVLPFQRESFFGADEANVEAMFSYEIDSTDFAIVVALKVEPNLNSFAATFIEANASVITGAEFEVFMDTNQWRTQNYRINATADEGVQLIQMGNIRAEMRMTEGEQSHFKIRLFAV